MRINIAHKIFGVAAIVLALMLIVAVYSLRLASKISDELDAIAGRHLPLSHVVAKLNIQAYEQEVLLLQLFDPRPGSPDTRERIGVLDREIHQDLAQIRKKLTAESRSADLARVSAQLESALAAIERKYRSYAALWQVALTHHSAEDRTAFSASLPDVIQQRASLEYQISGMYGGIQQLTDAAVVRTDRDEKLLLVLNAGLTAFAAILGLGLAALITRILVRNVRELVRGASAVEAGDLDVQIRVATRDEIGQLTRSFNQMVGGLRLKDRIKDTFGKYMDPRIVNRLLEHPELTESGGERREMSIMFIDLVGFTSISEQLPPDVLVRVINRFFTRMTNVVAANAGVVDKFMGDAVMAYWGPPFTGSDEHAALACKAALEALDQLTLLRGDLAAELATGTEGAKSADIALDIRIGISTGEVIVGSVGSSMQKNFTVMGDPVNLGSRLEGANKAYGTRVLISERSRVLAGDAIAAREIDLIRVKGKFAPTRIYELLQVPDEAAGQFAAGLAAYRIQDWVTADAAFTRCLSATPGDPPSAAYLARIAQLRASPPAADWDGVWEFQTK